MINASWLAMIRVIEIAGTITMMTATQVVRGAPRTLVDIDWTTRPNRPNMVRNETKQIKNGTSHAPSQPNTSDGVLGYP
jgi:hypothetical protein